VSPTVIHADNRDALRDMADASVDACVCDLSAGLAAEHLVCADLLLSGYRAFLASQTCPYDVAVECGTRLIRVQVKSTRRLRLTPQRANPTTAYLFYTRRAGKGGKRTYAESAFDMFALVALDIRCIAYIPARRNVLQTIQLKPPGTPESTLRRLRRIDQYPFKSALEGVLDG